MTHYRITVTPLSPSETALVSGTVWGHLAWAVRYVEGESVFENWLSEQEKQPWLVSSQMPVGKLPRPLLSPPQRPSGNVSIEELDEHKKLTKAAFISEGVFTKLRNGMSEPALLQAMRSEDGDAIAIPGTGKAEGSRSLRLAHNRIDRRSGRTPEEGGLFFEEVEIPEMAGGLQLFMFTPTPCLERLQSLFGYIGSVGFGANASTGRGQIKFEIQEEQALFEGRGARAMSLSHGILTGNMQEPKYKQHTHFGRLGGHFASGSFSPFKYPILMMRPGATFRPADEGPFGKLVPDVHHDPALQGVRQHALHLPLFFTEVAP